MGPGEIPKDKVLSNFVIWNTVYEQELFNQIRKILMGRVSLNSQETAYLALSFDAKIIRASFCARNKQNNGPYCPHVREWPEPPIEVAQSSTLLRHMANEFPGKDIV